MVRTCITSDSVTPVICICESGVALRNHIICQFVRDVWLNAHSEEISIVTGADEMLRGLTSSHTIRESSVIVSGPFRGSQHTIVGS